MTDRWCSHILVPTDFQPHRRVAYRVALATAKGTGAVVTLLHVAPMPNRELEEQEFSGLDALRLMHRSAEQRWGSWKRPAEVIAAENAELETRLRAEITLPQSQPVRVNYVVCRGEVVPEVIRYARTGGVDLVVVAGSPPGLLPNLGRSLADRLSREVPVEVIRATTSSAPVHRQPSQI